VLCALGRVRMWKAPFVFEPGPSPGSAPPCPPSSPAPPPQSDGVAAHHPLPLSSTNATASPLHAHTENRHWKATPPSAGIDRAIESKEKEVRAHTHTSVLPPQRCSDAAPPARLRARRGTRVWGYLWSSMPLLLRARARSERESAREAGAALTREPPPTSHPSSPPPHLPHKNRTAPRAPRPRCPAPPAARPCASRPVSACSTCRPRQ
jgi:hypothetical protein